MSQLKQLLEKATQKNEMKWRVYAYDPAKDNELVHTSKTFDCINDAGIEKAELLKKNPDYTIEIVAESAQKNEAFRPDDIVPFNKQMEFKKQYLQGKDKRKINPNSFYFDNVYAVDDNTGSNIPGAKLGMKYKDLAAALDKFFNEAADIDVKNPGVLEVPDGKKVDELPQSHFEELVDKKGYAEVIRALTNLEVWNKDKNKSLSSWASNMADKLKKKFRPESNEKEDKIKKAKKELDDLYYQMARAGAAGIEPPQSMFDRKNELIKFLKANESTQINETRSYKVTVKLEVPDKMNNRDIEDYIENKVDNSNFGVYVLDVTAERA